MGKKYDMSNENISNSKGRMKWIKTHKKFIYTLTPNLKLICLILYCNRELNCVLDKIKIFGYSSWSHLNKQFKLLEDIGFIKLEKIGRIVTWKITKKGDKYCEVLLKKLKKPSLNK
jgi:hypothetical protein